MFWMVPLSDSRMVLVVEAYSKYLMADADGEVLILFYEVL